MDLLKIMSGQNLEATPHMSFFLATANGSSTVKKDGKKVSSAGD